MIDGTRSRSALRLLAVTAVLGMLAACGGGGPGQGDANAAARGPNQDTSKAEGAPVRGGNLVYGVEADTANAWAHYRASYAASGYVALSAISDPLFGANAKGDTVPMLAESVTHNADYSSWTITVRSGIKFHDGTPLDGAAVKFNIDSCVGSPLTGAAYSSIGTVTASGQSVTITTKRGPWVVLPAYFGYGQCGYMLSKKWLESLPDVPQRQAGNPVFDAALAATPAAGNPAEPVGVGAFKFQSYKPGNGNSFKAVRNDDYWRGPKGITGEQLPYLDSIEMVVSVDVDGRSNALRSGGFDIMHTANAQRAADFLADPKFETITTNRYGETSYVMLNVAQGTNPVTSQPLDPTGVNTKNPMNTLPCRRALAHAIDLDRISAEVGGGLTTPANGPFPPGSRGNLPDSGYPKYDVAAAKSEMAKCLQERGTPRIEMQYNTTNDPVNVETNTLIASMWKEAFGDQVNATITPIEQGQYIGLALTGNFQLFGWRSHGGTDPDQQLLWWHSASAAPMGKTALNFGRFADPEIDKALATIRGNPDEAARLAATEALNKRFASQVYNLWIYWTVWGVVSAQYVNDQGNNKLPDGSEGIGVALAGRHQLNQVWCVGGKCE